MKRRNKINKEKPVSSKILHCEWYWEVSEKQGRDEYTWTLSSQLTFVFENLVLNSPWNQNGSFVAFSTNIINP